MPGSRGRGLAFISLAAISWGTTGSVTAVLVERAGAGALLIGAVRMLLAGVLLLLLARASGPIRIARADRWRCGALGVCMAAFQACYFGVAALLLAPVLAGPDVGRQIALGWPWLLYLGAVTTAGAYAIYTIGLRDVPASAAGVASLLEPLTATLLGVGLFGERLGAAGVVGAVLLFAALALLLTREEPTSDGSVATPRG